MVTQLIVNQSIVGSSPTSPAIFMKDLIILDCLFNKSTLDLCDKWVITAKNPLNAPKTIGQMCQEYIRTKEFKAANTIYFKYKAKITNKTLQQVEEFAIWYSFFYEQKKGKPISQDFLTQKCQEYIKK